MGESKICKGKFLVILSNVALLCLIVGGGIGGWITYASLQPYAKRIHSNEHQSINKPGPWYEELIKKSNRIITLRQRDFDNGTYRISKSGHYKLV